jgi:hypothetical protein
MTHALTIPKVDAEMTAFAADVLESIKQAKRIESAQIHKLDTSNTAGENTDEFEIRRLDIQPRSIDLGNSTNN